MRSDVKHRHTVCSAARTPYPSGRLRRWPLRAQPRQHGRERLLGIGNARPRAVASSAALVSASIAGKHRMIKDRDGAIGLLRTRTRQSPSRRISTSAPITSHERKARRRRLAAIGAARVEPRRRLPSLQLVAPARRSVGRRPVRRLAVSRMGNAACTCATNQAASLGPGSSARSLIPVTPSSTQAARGASAGQKP